MAPVTGDPSVTRVRPRTTDPLIRDERHWLTSVTGAEDDLDARRTAAEVSPMPVTSDTALTPPAFLERAGAFS